MVCMNCKKNQATMRFLRAQDNQTTELWLCKECADAQNLLPPVEPKKFSIAELMAGMVDSMASTEEGRVGPVQCPVCGMHYSTFKESGRLGCAMCYESFEIKLRPLLRRIHGSTRHTGKHPAKDETSVARTRQLQRLRDELQRAIDREDFERAAEIRDQLKEGSPAGEGNRETREG